jgi:hypothetical protein
MDHFMPGDLKPIYCKLNFLDPVVRCRATKNQWGGSGDIGGSPRGVGTRLSPLEIAQACRDVFHTPSLMQRIMRFAHALAVVAGITAAAAALRHYLPSTAWFSSGAGQIVWSQTDLLFYLGIVLLAALGLALYSRGHFWRFGLAGPIDRAWWFLLPVIVLAALAGGVVIPWKDLRLLNTGLKTVYAVVLVPVATELLFRGLAHGILAAGSRVQSCGNRMFLSYPAAAAALLYALFTTALVLGPDLMPAAHQSMEVLRTFLAALGLGLMAGLVREKSHSLLPSILFQAVAVTVLVFVTGLIF